MTRPSIAVAAPTERNERWLVVALLAVGVIIAYANRINLSSALPEIRRSFPMSLEASGILLSAFFWAYTVLQTPAGWVVDRFGLKWTYAVGLFVWSAVSAATALVLTGFNKSPTVEFNGAVQTGLVTRIINGNPAYLIPLHATVRPAAEMEKALSK